MLPETLEASPQRLTAWVQTLCGMELTSNEALRVLSPQDWEKPAPGTRRARRPAHPRAMSSNSRGRKSRRSELLAGACPALLITVEPISLTIDRQSQRSIE